jgi:hypothetical protein
VKRSFFRLQTGDQFFDSIKHSPVVHSGRYPLVMLDLAVEFDALLTHFQFRIARGGRLPLAAFNKMPKRLICSLKLIRALPEPRRERSKNCCRIRVGQP